MKKQAFTLVELIVVITILAILGAISFINFQGFSSSSRDSKRINEVLEIGNALQIEEPQELEETGKLEETKKTEEPQKLEETQLIGWRTLDSNCKIEDISFDFDDNGIPEQIWAGCNSTLGNGFEWGKKDDGTDGIIGSCNNYDGINNKSDIDCAIGNINMASNSSAKYFFDLMQIDGANINGDSEYNTIWGKLYTGSNSSSACPDGWHVPTDNEWELLETHLNSGVNCRSSTEGWLCNGLGWSSENGTKLRSLANELKIPLSGHRNADGFTFNDRGYYAHLWSSGLDGSSNFRRSLHWNNFTIGRHSSSHDRGLSVRCLKN